MVRLETYLNQPLAITLGWTLLHSLWQGALIVLIFAGCLALVRFRPQIRYLLGCAALLLLIVLPLGTGVALYRSADTQPSVNSTAEPKIELGGDTFTTVEPNVKDVLQTAAAPGVTSSEPWVVAAWALLANSAPWLAGAWLLGVYLLLLRLLGQAVYVHRFRTRQPLPASPHWQARAKLLARRLGVSQAWHLVQTERIDSPLTFGALRPIIVLPVSALTGMPAVQLEALLAHELAHIKRYDYLVNLSQRIVETLLFYHPAVWWVSNIIRRAREECCDDVAVAVCGDAKLYAKALTNLEVLRHRQPPLTLAATDKPLLERVRRLIGLGEMRHTPPFATGAFLLFVMLATTVFSLSPTDATARSASNISVQPSSSWVSVSPSITFDDAYTHIDKVFNASAYVLVEARSPTEQRTVRVTRGTSDTDFVYTYKVDGKVQPFDKEARAWFNSSLQTGALGPLKQYVSVQAQLNDDEGGQLSSYLTYDEPTSRYISLVRVADAHLSPDATLTAETDVRKRTLLNVVAHYAAQKLVADREIGAYLKLFIERTRASQLQGLVPDILSIIPDIEDKAVKTDVKLALEKRLQGAAKPEKDVAGQTVATQLRMPSNAQVTPKRGASINGVVVWNHQRLSNIEVKLYRETDPEVWNTPPALQTTSTNAKGEYKFEDVSPGNYTVWALGRKAGYQDMGYPATSYAETSGYVVLRVDKPIELISPKATTGVSLTPTLRWQPVPGAVRYEVGLDDVTPPEDLTKGRRYYRTDKPSLELTEPLERNRLYIWSVEAYAEDGTRIASDIEGPTFSTGREEALRLVKLQGIAASTSLPSNWQESSPDIFTYTNADGEKGSVTFAKRSLTELGARGTSSALTQLKQAPRRYNGRNWGLGFDALRDGKLSLITLQDGFAYLITLDGVEYEGATLMTFELAGIIMPTILRNFEISD